MFLQGMVYNKLETATDMATRKMIRVRNIFGIQVAIMIGLASPR